MKDYSFTFNPAPPGEFHLTIEMNNNEQKPNEEEHQENKLLLYTIMAKLNELTSLLAGINTSLDEATGEIVAKIEELKDANPDLPEEAVALLDSISAKATTLKDIVPTVVPEPEVGEGPVIVDEVPPGPTP